MAKKMKGSSSRYEGSAHMGQTIRCEGAPDKSSHVISQEHALMGQEMAGGTQDVSHSLPGAGDVPRKPRVRGGKVNYGNRDGRGRDNNMGFDSF